MQVAPLQAVHYSQIAQVVANPRPADRAELLALLGPYDPIALAHELNRGFGCLLSDQGTPIALVQATARHAAA